MKKKLNIPSENFSDQDAELLVKHYGKPPEESKIKQIMEDAEKQRSAFLEQEQRLEPKRDPSRKRNR